MRKATKPAADSAAFQQWLANMPATVRPNQFVPLDCKVELFTTAWMDVAAIAQRMNWTIEQTVSELVSHCSDLFQTDEGRLLRHIGADDERIAAILDAVKPNARN